MAGTESDNQTMGIVSVRLTSEMMDMLDSAIDNGTSANRSEAIRKILTAFRNLTLPGGEGLLMLLAHFLSEPLEMLVWFHARGALMMMGDEEQRRYAGRVVAIAKVAATMAEVKIDPREVRERFLRIISADFYGHQVLPEGTIPDEAAKAEPLSKMFDLFIGRLDEAAKAEPLSKVFDLFVSRLTERIKAGAAAAEIAQTVMLLINIAYGCLRLDRWDDVPVALRSVLALIPRPDDGVRVDPLQVREALDTWALGVPALYDKVELLEQVKELILRDVELVSSHETETSEKPPEVSQEEKGKESQNVTLEQS